MQISDRMYCYVTISRVVASRPSKIMQTSFLLFWQARLPIVRLLLLIMYKKLSWSSLNTPHTQPAAEQAR